jgi:quercetin dioxygenase-like cupin family protein
MYWRMPLFAVAVSFVAFGVIREAEATSTSSNSEVSRRILERSPIPGTDEELRLMQVEFPPGYSNAAHRHPVAGVCYILEGKALSQYDGEDVKELSAGQSFQDQANNIHTMFRNASAKDPLRFICAAKIKTGVQYMQPLPDPR